MKRSLLALGIILALLLAGCDRIPMPAPFGEATVNVTAGVGETRPSTETVDNDVLIQAQPQKAYACLVVSCPEMRSGQTNTVTVGTLSGELEAS